MPPLGFAWVGLLARGLYIKFPKDSERGYNPHAGMPRSEEAMKNLYSRTRMRAIVLAGTALAAGVAVAAVRGAAKVPTALVALPAGDDASVAQADQSLVAALIRGDKAAVNKLLDANFAWTDVDGKTISGSQGLPEIPRLLATGAGAHASAHTYGDVATVRVDDGLVHVLRVWVKRSAGWKLRVYQEVRSLAAPPVTTPGPGADCANPCRDVLYQPKNDVERGVISSYMGLETASVGHEPVKWGPHVADEFVAASSYSNKLLTKPERMEELGRSQMSGLAPTPVVTMHLTDFGDTVVMESKQQPDKGKPLHITRVWTKRDGNWVIVLAFQTAIQSEPAKS